MTYAPGMILAYDCGYNMSLPHFVRVESLTPSGKSVRVVELAADFESFDPPYNTRGVKTPSERVIGNIMTCRITKGGCVKVGYHYAYPWNGKPMLYDCMD